MGNSHSVDFEAVIHISNLYKWFERNRNKQKPIVIITKHTEITNKEELVKSMSNLVHENRIFFFENHLDMKTDIPQEKLQQIELMFQKIEVENMKARPNSKVTNILVFGPQHSGKSSLINTLYKYFNRNIKVAVCDVGRKAEVGTVNYEKVLLGHGANHHEYQIFDTAGKPFEKGMDDINQVRKLLDGLPTGVNLSLSEWMESPTVEENAAGFVFIVVTAELLTKLEKNWFVSLFSK